MKREKNNVKLGGHLPDLHTIGVSIWDPIYAKMDHVGSDWEVVHIIRGTIVLHIEGATFNGEAGDTLLIPANSRHRDGFPLGSDFEVLHIQFQWKDAKKFFTKEVNADLANLPLVDKQRIRELAYETYDCFRGQRLMWRERTEASLYRLLLFMGSVARELHLPRPKSDEAASKRRRKELIQAARDYIKENIHQPVTLAGIAEYLDISAWHLSHLFSEESGFTLSSYLTQLRMQAASDLLKNTKARVSEVANAVGYEDPNYFSKVFRKQFGCSPGRYRTRK